MLQNYRGIERAGSASSEKAKLSVGGYFVEGYTDLHMQKRTELVSCTKARKVFFWKSPKIHTEYKTNIICTIPSLYDLYTPLEG